MSPYVWAIQTDAQTDLFSYIYSPSFQIIFQCYLVNNSKILIFQTLAISFISTTCNSAPTISRIIYKFMNSILPVHYIALPKFPVLFLIYPHQTNKQHPIIYPHQTTECFWISINEIKLFPTLALHHYCILYIPLSENLMLFSIRLQFHLGPGPNLFYTSKEPSCMLTSVLFKLINCIFEEYKLKKER